MRKLYSIAILAIFSLAFFSATYYPIDGYEQTGIKRLLRLERLKSGEIQGKLSIPEGAMKSWSEINLNLTEKKNDSLANFFQTDQRLQAKINALFKGLDKSYSISILDISDLDSIRYASRNEKAAYQPGSVGKLAVLVGLFTQLQRIYPDSWESRTELLRIKTVKAGQWGLTDSHTIPIYNPETNALVKRPVVAADVFSLYEWTDHMLSVSNNGAASIVWREVLLMAAFGSDYPTLTEEQSTEYFATTPKNILTNLGNDVVNLPLRELGITAEEWRLGSFFTQGANKYVGNKGGSTGSPLGLMKFLIQLEQGNVVDQQSSLEIKRLMYMTDRRIRYAQSPALAKAAVYFKSGSLYRCDRTKGEACDKYMGNVDNFMNSVAIIEHPNNCKYMVVLMTNVLRKNSATDHMYLASSLDKIVQKR